MMRSPWSVSTILLFSLLIVFGACSEDDPLVPPADTIAPTVVSTVPADSAAAVSLSTAVSATFSESMDAQTVNASSFTLLLQQTDPVDGAVSLSGNVTTFAPDQPLIAGVEYEARLDATVADRSGNTLQDDYVCRRIAARARPRSVGCSRAFERAGFRSGQRSAGGVYRAEWHRGALPRDLREE